MSTRLPLVMAAFAVVLFGTAGIVRMMGWGDDSIGVSGDILAPARADSAVGTIRTRPKCPDCGTIVSMREIESEDTGAVSGLACGTTSTYEILVHMADGTTRKINHANPANWRPGQRVVIIDGASPPGR